MDSILTSIKKMLGIDKEYTHFDPELIIFINSAFGVLFQLGVGPTDEPFVITGEKEVWEDFIDGIDGEQLETVKSYVYMKVKLLFDPPSSSFVLSSYQDLIKEFEWRCHVHAETP